MSRPEPASSVGAARCKYCAYCIEDLLSPGVCPECGLRFDFSDPSSFTRRPPFLGWRFWFPGVALAAGLGILGLAIGAFGFQSWGGSLWLATPTAIGGILGYRLRTGPIWTAFACIVGLATFVLGVFMLGLGGVFCGLVLSAIVLGPIALGVLFGQLLRTTLKNAGFSQRSYLPVIVIFAGQLASYAVDRPSPAAIETVTTSAVFEVPARDAYDSIVFYEQVTHPPPWILRIGLARPISTTGSARAVGDVKTCLYNKGRIVKRITRAERGVVLAFDVIEQSIGYERDVALKRGAFEFVPLGPSRTLVKLSTTYEPLLRPRWCWRWGEEIGIHTLHRHVLEGMKLRAGMDELPIAFTESNR